MAKQKGSYYIPKSSAWPIIGALALLLFSFGTLHTDSSWGLGSLIVGLSLLFIMMWGWLRNVMRESRAGFYTPQMDQTFRWGMFWFLISELFLFGLLLGAALHVRFSITPWIAGQSGSASRLTHYLLWPDFTAHWPLTTLPRSTPGTPYNYFPTLIPIFFVNLTFLFTTTLFLTKALIKLKKKASIGFRWLILPLSSATLFFLIQADYFVYLVQGNFALKTGIYGSFLLLFLGLHLINSFAALFLLYSLVFKMRHSLLKDNLFSFHSVVWWWDFLTAIWIVGFLFIF